MEAHPLAGQPAPPDVLIDAVRRAAAGETVLAPPVAKRLVEREGPEVWDILEEVVKDIR